VLWALFLILRLFVKKEEKEANYGDFRKRFIEENQPDDCKINIGVEFKC